MTDKYDVDDLVVAAVERRPTDFANMFGDLMIDRLNDAVAQRKQEIAQSMFSTPVADESEE